MHFNLNALIPVVPYRSYASKVVYIFLEVLFRLFNTRYTLSRDIMMWENKEQCEREENEERKRKDTGEKNGKGKEREH